MAGIKTASSIVTLFLAAACCTHAGAAEEFRAEAVALPYPPDAVNMEFTAWAGDINYHSQSTLKSLAAFYLKEMAARGWELDESEVDIDDDSIELLFKHGDAEVEVSFRQYSKESRVSLDTKGLKFTDTDDPAKLAEAGIPTPRAALYVQKEIALPEGYQNLVYKPDGCMLKSPMKLQEAFDYFSAKVKAKGFRESRRPIITDTRRYTEFTNGPVEMGVNVFTDEVGSRIVLTYEDQRKAPAVAPLPAVASLSIKNPGSPDAPTTGEPAAPPVASTPIDVVRNKGSITVIHGGKKYTFSHVACFQTKDRGDYATMVVFSAKPIPLNKLQSLVANEDDPSFGELYEFDLPSYLVLQLGKYLSFSYSVPGVGIGHSIEKSDDKMVIADGRVKGTFKMEPEDIFDKPFSFTATIDAAVITPNTRIAGPADPIEVSNNGFDWPIPFPAGCEDLSREGSRFRKSYHAEVPLTPAKVAAFYNTELPAKGWQVVNNEGGKLSFKTDTMELTATMKPQGEKTMLDIVTHDVALARKEGVLPEPGKGRLIMANAHRIDVVFTIGKTDYKLKAGRGAEDFKQALNYSIPPATYPVVIKIPGQPEKTERIEVTEGTTWGVIALPTGGYMPIQLY